MSDLRKNDMGRPCNLLGAYEMDLLEPDERLHFESHLETCADCLEELYAMAPATGALKADPGAYAAAAARSLSAHEPPPWRRLLNLLWPGGRLGYLLPTLVTAALAVAVLWPEADTSSRYAGLVDLQPIPWVQIDVRGGGQDQAISDWSQGMDLYRQADYAGAADHLSSATEALPADSRQQRQAQLYLGVSELLTGHTDRAVAPLLGAATSPLPPIADRARWYLAQAYLLQDEAPRARAVLEELTSSPVYGPQAKQLLEDLR